MTLRDGIGVAVGASLSFALGLAATAKDPTGFLTWGLIVSVCLLGGLLAAELLRGPWISAHVTPLEAVNGYVVLRIGFTNHGYRDFGQSIVNVLVPDDAGLAESRGGTRSADRLLHTPESVDGVHESDYWNAVMDLVQEPC